MKVCKRQIEVIARQYRADSGRLIPGLVYYYAAGDPAQRTPRSLERVTCDTLEGPYEVNEGDWIVYGQQGEPYPVPADKFTRLYAPIADDRYRSIPHVRDAIRMPNRFTIHCSGGDLTGNAGDWLMLATPDDAYPVAAAIFDATYDVLDAAHCGSSQEEE